MFRLTHLKQDLAAGIVVYLVALPLCLGIALASGAPLFSGIISGIVAGTVVALLSGSELSVSGPAAGLTVMIAAGIATSGSYEIFLAAVVMAGLLQIFLGAIRLGSLANFFPSSVIHGMLAGIGVIIVLKQIPHGLGRSRDFEGDLSFWQISDQENTFTEIIKAMYSYSPGILSITLLSLFVLWLWSQNFVQRKPYLAKLPAPLIAVCCGLGLNELFLLLAPNLAAEPEHLVQLPLINGDTTLDDILKFPQFSRDNFWLLFGVAVPLSIVASIETLLCVEASDKLDPHRRMSGKNRELFAQGIGNVICGLIGGLPMTSVIVRSSANIYAGAKTRLANLIHGLLLLSSALVIPTLLNKIPLGALAAVLISVGYKLTKPILFKKMWVSGIDQFLPFIITIIAIVFSDLLTGVLIGLVISLIFVIIANYHSAITVVNDGNNYFFRFKKDVSFVNKSALKQYLADIPKDSSVLIDGTSAVFIDKDIYDVIDDFRETATYKNIKIELRNMDSKQFSFFAEKKDNFHAVVSKTTISKQSVG